MTHILFRARPTTHLVRRWIATTDPRHPLTSVWMEAPCTSRYDERCLPCMPPQPFGRRSH